MAEIKVLRVMKLKLKREPGDKMRVQVFLGPDEDHYHLAGEVRMNVGEYQDLGCALRMGVDRMVQRPSEATYIPMKVTVEGEMAALGRENELDGRPDVSVFPEVD